MDTTILYHILQVVSLANLLPTMVPANALFSNFGEDDYNNADEEGDDSDTDDIVDVPSNTVTGSCCLSRCLPIRGCTQCPSLSFCLSHLQISSPPFAHSLSPPFNGSYPLAPASSLFSNTTRAYGSKGGREKKGKERNEQTVCGSRWRHTWDCMLK